MLRASFRMRLIDSALIRLLLLFPTSPLCGRSLALRWGTTLSRRSTHHANQQDHTGTIIDIDPQTNQITQVNQITPVLDFFVDALAS